jgi:hypothetical protein
MIQYSTAVRITGSSDYWILRFRGV